MEFPPLDRRLNLISLEFATVQRNSLLLYNAGGSSSREFFALEILDGATCLSYDLGSGLVRLRTNKQVTDGHFHSITARRIGNVSFKHIFIYARLSRKQFSKIHIFVFAFYRWVLYMSTTAQMLRTMNFVFPRVMTVAQRGTI